MLHIHHQCFSIAVCCSMLFVVALGAPDSKYFIGELGQSCSEVCYLQNLNCNPHIVTNDSASIFEQLGVNCTEDSRNWWAHDQPCFVGGTGDPNYGRCLGYTQVPGGVLCSGSFPASQRLCRCDAPSSSVRAFGTGVSSGQITSSEQMIFQHIVAPGDVGVMTHFWITYEGVTDRGVIIRYYIDDESSASIVFTPSLACGVGGWDAQAPWGTKWFGKGAKDGAWFLNFRVPFQHSIRITAQHEYMSSRVFWMIVRGATNVPINIGGISVPSTARLGLSVQTLVAQPLDYIPVLDVSGVSSGLVFMHTLAVESGNLNFLEGCYHMFVDDQDFPGTLLSTGTEDYFDSAWYFNGGEFHSPVAGFTHYNETGGISWSAYRFHEMDPLQFDDNIKLVWRNGDTLDAAGVKCMMETGGDVVGTPTVANVTSYVWYYYVV